MTHRLGWEDDGMALLTHCGTARIEDGPVLHASHYPDDARECPVCHKMLRLNWQVTVEEAAPPPATTETRE